MCQLTHKFIMKTHLGKGWHQTKPWGSYGVLGCNICSIKLQSDASIPRLFTAVLLHLKQILTSSGHTSLNTDSQRPNVSINSLRHDQLKQVVKIHNTLTRWKKEVFSSCMLCLFVMWNLLLLIYLFNIEFDIHLKYWIYLWSPPICYVMNLIW